MENQHKLIIGYRDLSKEEIDLMNKIKVKGQEMAALVEEVHKLAMEATLSSSLANAGSDIGQPLRWVSIAQTDLQTGIMALTRAVARPTTF